MNFKIILFIIFIFSSSLLSKDYLTSDEIKQLQEKYQGRSGERFKNWNTLIKVNLDKNKSKQAQNVDKYFNQYRYKGDFKYDSSGKRYKSDFFRSFNGFIGEYGGDCDDYAIMKYFSLLKLGVPENRLKLYVGGFKSNRINHAVLAYFIDNSNDPLILDSNTNWAVKLSKRTNFEPWFYANRLESGVMVQTLKKYNEYDKLHSYESSADYMMLKIERWFRKNSF